MATGRVCWSLVAGLCLGLVVIVSFGSSCWRIVGDVVGEMCEFGQILILPID